VWTLQWKEIRVEWKVDSGTKGHTMSTITNTLVSPPITS